jgi:SAM-dependent methyltransferase
MARLESLARRLRWVGGDIVPERRQLLGFATRDRGPFYALAERYLPADPAATVVDVGAGHGGFVSKLGLVRRYARCYLLDGNAESVARLKELGGEALRYTAPDPLPFLDASVDFVHCSHLVEHLSPQDLHTLLGEWDRVLRPGGVLVVSAPLLWDLFYGDLTHVRPYEPEVFVKYLVGSEGARSREVVSVAYEVMETTYRYDARPVLQGVRATYAWLDWPVLVLAKLCWALGLRRFERSGFTLVLRKGRGREP